MKNFKLFLLLFSLSTSSLLYAQVESAGEVRKRKENSQKESKVAVNISEKLKNSLETQHADDADLSYKKEVYRNLDLQKGSNGALYYPEDVIEGQENLFRILFNKVLEGTVPAYEYLDGREIFTDQYKMGSEDILNRFDIYAQPVKNNRTQSTKYFVEEADVPANQVQNYYIIEDWEFDRRSNSMKSHVTAICPVLTRFNDYGAEEKYPMFWVKYQDIAPFLINTFVFIDDDNNIPQYSLNDFFNLGLYDGEIYKTRNLRNLSMSQIYSDEESLKHAQDSIDNHLKNYGKNIWVPSREEYLASKEENSLKENNKETSEINSENTSDNQVKTKGISYRTKKKAAKKSRYKASQGSSESSAEKSVRRRKK